MKCKVLNTAGDTALGSDDVDSIMLQQMEDGSKVDAIKLLKQYHIAKEGLCTNNEKPPNSMSITYKHYRIKLIQDTFNKLIELFCTKAISLLQKSIQSSKKLTSSQDINEVVIVGGRSKIPKLQSMIYNEVVSHLPSLCKSNNAYLTVGQSATICATMQSKLVPMHALKNALMMDSLAPSV